MLKYLLRRHKKYPNAIIGHRIRRIRYNARYKSWKLYKRISVLKLSFKPSFRNLQTGVGGVLYPPHSLSKKMLRPEVFMQLAPTVDDIWFWAAAVAKRNQNSTHSIWFLETTRPLKNQQRLP